MVARPARIANRTERRQRVELERRETAYRGTRPPLSAKDQIVILVDDGAATGASMLAAVRAVRRLQAKKVIVALPAASIEAHQSLVQEADEVVCLGTPMSFHAVGKWYVDFSQTSDAEVTELLARTEAAHV